MYATHSGESPSSTRGPEKEGGRRLGNLMHAKGGLANKIDVDLSANFTAKSRHLQFYKLYRFDYQLKIPTYYFASKKSDIVKT